MSSNSDSKAKQDLLSDLIDKENYDKNILLEQYKLYVDDAQKTSDRRSLTNNFFLSGITILFTAISFLFNNNVKLALILLDSIGISLAIVWGLQLDYYNKLNSSKFTVINAVEKKLSANGFKTEWDIFKSKKRLGLGASRLELFLPTVLCISFIVFLIYHISK